MSNRASEHSINRSPAAGDVLDLVREKLKLLRFGTISLTVHDGHLIQMDVTEKRRFGH